jgi:hypothetical protein
MPKKRPSRLSSFISKYGPVNGAVIHRSAMQAIRAGRLDPATKAAERKRHYTMIENLPK